MNESSLHEESKYVIMIMIARSTDISVFGTGRVNSRTLADDAQSAPRQALDLPLALSATSELRYMLVLEQNVLLEECKYSISTFSQRSPNIF